MVDFKNITHAIQGLAFQNIPFNLLLPKSEVLSILKDVIKKAFENNKQLGDRVTLLSIDELAITNEQIHANATIRVFFESKFMPNYSDIQVDILLNWTLTNLKPYIEKIEINKNILSDGMAQKLIGVAADTFLLFKEESVIQQITQDINVHLQDPSTILPWIQSIASKINQVDYTITTFNIQTLEEAYLVQCTPNIFANYHENSIHQTIYFSANEKELKPILLDLVRTNIPALDNIELDIEDMEISNKNQIRIQANVTTRGMNIAFEMELKLRIDTESQKLAMEVVEIIPKGNFIIRKTFQLAAPIIKNMIEEKASIDLNILKSKLPILIKNDKLLNEYQLDMEQVKIMEITMFPLDGSVKHSIVFEDALIDFRPQLQKA